jgi:hypothetical protein
MVLIDGVAVTPLSVTNTEIQVQVPINVTPGNHVLRVQVDAEFSNSVPFQVEIFTVTGTYIAQGPVVLNSCLDFGVGDPVGTPETFELAMTDSRPTLTGRIGAIPLQGTLTSGGSFNMSRTEENVTTRVEGSMIATPQGAVGFSGRTTLSSSGVLVCSIVTDLIGARVSTIPTSRVPSLTKNVRTSSEDNILEAFRSMMVLEAQ